MASAIPDVSNFTTNTTVYNATVTAIETATGAIPDTESVTFEEIDLADYALASAIPVVSSYATHTEVYDAVVTGVQTATGLIPDTKEITFKEVNLSDFALASAIPTVQLNSNDQVTAINNHEIAGTGGGGTTYTAGNCISIANDNIAWITTAGITDIQMVTALPQDPVSSVLYIIPEA